MTKLRELLNHKQFPVVLGASAVILVGVLTLSQGTSAVDPSVILEQGERIPEKQAPFVPGAQRLIDAMDGEVSRMADRVEEAVALAFSAGVYLGSEGIRGRRPADVQALVSGIAQNNLLPPSLKISQSAGTLVSSWGSVSVRYRPEPLGVEVISIPSKPEYGPALIVRSLDGSSDKAEARLFVADQSQGLSAPGPFTSIPELIAGGWNPEELRSINGGRQPN
jgi:hypothetical protein